MLNLYYHPYQWQITPHTGANGNKYLQDIDIKPKWIVSKLKSFKNVKLIKSKPLSWKEYKATHNHEYVDKIIHGNPEEISKYNWITWSKSFVRAQPYIGGAIYQSANNAIQTGISGALVAEGHHAMPRYGSGYSSFNHLVVALQKLLKEGKVNKVAIIDADVHLGDGTISMLNNNPKIRILDLYKHIHMTGAPLETKNAHTILINRKEDYIPSLKKAINTHILPWNPDIVFYIAGADIYEHDRYGGINDMSVSDVKKRDEVIFSKLRQKNISIYFTLGGGYVDYSKPNITENQNTLTKLHSNTILTASNFTF